MYRFLEFFTKIPKLAEKDIHKEILIVDSEHLSKANKDSWRKLGVDASTAKKSHPFHKFTTGARNFVKVPNILYRLQRFSTSIKLILNSYIGKTF